MRPKAMIWLVILLLMLNREFHCHELCPVSSTMNLNNSNNYFYPLDVYAGVQVRESTSETFTCYGSVLRVHRYPHNCSNVRFCPVHLVNVADAVSRPIRDVAFPCYLKTKLSNYSEHVRVFAFGGSLTAGSGAMWCNSWDRSHRLAVNKQCAWLYHFGEWLKSYAAANVTYYNFGRSGFHSYLSSRRMLDMLQESGIHRFTSNDIIFLDHGVNDDTKSPLSVLESRIEGVIRSVYTLSLNGSWPYVVLLDNNAAKSFGPSVELYVRAYEKISAYYGVPFWSFKDTANSAYVTTMQSQYSKALNYEHNFHRDIHPPWHVHLFQADLYAAILLNQFNQCTEALTRITETWHNTPRQLRPVLSQAEVIPCAANTLPYLSVSYDSVLRNTSIGNFSSTSWTIGEDEKGRGGFSVQLASAITTNMTGKMGGDITFVLNQPTPVLRKRKLQMQVLYLRTYSNAGVVQVRVCGRPVRYLDALWDDYQTNQISIPELVEIAFPIEMCHYYSHPTVEFMHRVWSLECGVWSSCSEVSPVPVRLQQKFKLLAVKVCEMS